MLHRGVQWGDMKNILLALSGLIIIAVAVFFIVRSQSDSDLEYEKPDVTVPTTTPGTQVATSTEVATTSEETASKTAPITTIGTSVEGREIRAYHFGTGDRELLLIGGMHGGYSWNTAALAYELIDWLAEDPKVIPTGVRVTVVPVLNPDGLVKVTAATSSFTAKNVTGNETTKVASRFNANKVDLNRNFDCEWASQGTWQSRTVSGGSAPFSEPESQALRDYVAKHEPSAVVVWYSSAGGVYASRCGDTTMPATITLMNRFATASQYPAYEEFDYYEITGDLVNWLAKEEIPAISVLLTAHDTTELTKNKAGVTAVLQGLK